MPKKTKLKFAAIVEAMQKIDAEKAKKLEEKFDAIEQDMKKRRKEAYSHELEGVGSALVTFAIFLGAMFIFTLLYGSGKDSN